MMKSGRVQFNASGVRDAVTKSVGAQKFQENTHTVWEEWLQVSHDIMPDMRLVFGTGISAEDGIQAGWERLCQGLVGPEEGLVYKLGFLRE